MKKLLILFGLIFILTGCSEVKNYKAVLVDKDMNKQKAYNILIENTFIIRIKKATTWSPFLDKLLNLFANTCSLT